MIKFRKGKRYYSLLSKQGRILHIHHTGSASGEIHLDKPFWENVSNIKELCMVLSKSYKVKNLRGDIRITRSK